MFQQDKAQAQIEDVDTSYLQDILYKRDLEYKILVGISFFQVLSYDSTYIHILEGRVHISGKHNLSKFHQGN